MVTLVKLGGSLITDKTKRETFREEVTIRLAHEIHAALAALADMRIILGHGSGSFGHFEAKKYNTLQGVQSSEEWLGFAKVADVAAKLNFLVAQALIKADVPVFRVQPSASAIATNGIIVNMAVQPIVKSLEHGLVPLVYGDVAFDKQLGGTIVSTESVFNYLVSQFPVRRILLLGEVDGVYDQQGNVIPKITRDNYADIEDALGGSSGVDVTGGMRQKVNAMLDLANTSPYPEIQILNGLSHDVLRRALLGERVVGTTISA